MVMDSLPKLKSFFGLKLELGMKIFTLLVTALGYYPASMILAMLSSWFFDNNFLWVVYLPILVNVIVFGLAFIALQWNKTRKLLIPAAVLAPIWSLVGLICIIMIGMEGSAVAVIITLLFLLYSILIVYYWVGLITMYGLKKPGITPLINEA